MGYNFNNLLFLLLTRRCRQLSLFPVPGTPAPSGAKETGAAGEHSMCEKRLVVHIADQDLRVLKKAGYALCFAKHSKNEAYNMVWMADSQYGTCSQLSWEPRFAFFLAAEFADGKQVFITAQSNPIVLGQECTLLEFGGFGSPRTGTTTGAVALVLQNRNPVYPGLGQYCSLNGREGAIRPVCVAKNPVVPGMDVVYPEDKILVWFEQNTQSGMMFELSRSQDISLHHATSSCNRSWSTAYEADLTVQDYVTLHYQNMIWNET